MKSRIKHDLVSVDGVWTLIPKEYPNYRGLPDVGFIWKGSQSDPYLEYNGIEVNSQYVEEMLWSFFQEDEPGGDDERFELWIEKNKYLIYNYLEEATYEENTM